MVQLALAPARSGTGDKGMTMRISRRVVSRDGTGLAVWEAGAPDGRAILLLHGFSQCAMCFAAQAASPQLARFRLVMPDLRGHGASDKPLDRATYTDIGRWADDVAAVIEALALDRPVLGGWSHGGRIVCRYIADHGDAALGGVAFIAARLLVDPATLKPAARTLITAMGDPDLTVSLEATIDFVRMCAARPLPEDVLLRFVAFNMLVPPLVRAAMLGHELATEAAFARLQVPALLLHGADDAVIACEDTVEASRRLPGSTLYVYRGIGHAPFAEDADRFNADLAAFMDTIG